MLYEERSCLLQWSLAALAEQKGSTCVTAPTFPCATTSEEVSGSHPGAAGRQGLQKCRDYPATPQRRRRLGAKDKLKVVEGGWGGGQAAVSQRARFLSAVTLQRGCIYPLAPEVHRLL